jgi:NAD(P)-dependent dehydrogenase (short-subunit alcohol dehydrogenase family)
MTRAYLEADAVQRRTMIGTVPRRRLARPDDVADAARFPASDLAGYITGQTVTSGRGA